MPIQAPLGFLLTFLAAIAGASEVAVDIHKIPDRVTELTATFNVSRTRLFTALTRPEHQKHWMAGDGLTLAESHVDGRARGSFRFVYQRPSGKRIEVRGAYTAFDPPNGFAYVETYDFSPLRIEVATVLEPAGNATMFRQTLTYASQGERDEDFDGVASSSREALTKLACYLENPPPGS